MSLLLRLGLVLASAKQKAGDHVSHQILIAQRNYIKVGLPKILSISEQGGKEAVAAICRETKDENPVKKPLRLVKHLHRKLAVASLDDILKFTDRNLLDAFTAFLVLNLTC